MMILMGICGIWALGLYLIRRPTSGALLAAIILGEVLILVQGLFGLILLSMGGHMASPIHWIYGAAAAACLPVVYAYLQKRSPRTRLLFIGIGCLFVVALGVRGMMTAGAL